MRHLKCLGAFEPLELLLVWKERGPKCIHKPQNSSGCWSDRGGILRDGSSHGGTTGKSLGFQECCRKNLALMSFWKQWALPSLYANIWSSSCVNSQSVKRSWWAELHSSPKSFIWWNLQDQTLYWHIVNCSLRTPRRFFAILALHTILLSSALWKGKPAPSCMDFLRPRFCTYWSQWGYMLARSVGKQYGQLSVIKICSLSGTEGSGLKSRSAKDWLSGQNTSNGTVLCFCLVIK